MGYKSAEICMAKRSMRFMCDEMAEPRICAAGCVRGTWRWAPGSCTPRAKRTTWGQGSRFVARVNTSIESGRKSLAVLIAPAGIDRMALLRYPTAPRCMRKGARVRRGYILRGGAQSTLLPLLHTQLYYDCSSQKIERKIGRFL